MAPYLLATTLRLEAGGPNATPRSKKFKVGIPYVYALMFEVNISSDGHPPRDGADAMDAIDFDVSDAEAEVGAAEAEGLDTAEPRTPAPEPVYEWADRPLPDWGP